MLEGVSLDQLRTFIAAADEGELPQRPAGFSSALSPL